MKKVIRKVLKEAEQAGINHHIRKARKQGLLISLDAESTMGKEVVRLSSNICLMRQEIRDLEKAVEELKKAAAEGCRGVTKC